MNLDNVLSTTPIIISALALVLSGISLGWNIFRDVVLKPRVKVSVDKAQIHPGMGKGQTKLTIEAVNFGPGIVNLQMIRLKKHSIVDKLLRRSKFAAVIHDYMNPLSGQLPKALNVGEKIILILPWEKDSLLSDNPTHVGVSDTFGRMNWATRKNVKQARRKWEQDFT
jgi:hypothetical protein